MSPKRPKSCPCNPATGDVCGACFARRYPKRDPEADDRPGDSNVDGTDYEPRGSWAE